MIDRLLTQAQILPQLRQGADRQPQTPAFLDWMQAAAGGAAAANAGPVPADASETAASSTIEYGPGEEAGQPGWPIGELLWSPPETTISPSADASNGASISVAARTTLRPDVLGSGSASDQRAPICENAVGAPVPTPVLPSVDASTMPASHPIELHLRDASGHEEIIALPWRLAADGMLGQRIVDIVPPGVSSAVSEGGIVAADIAAGDIRASRPMPPMVVTAVTGAVERLRDKTPAAGAIDMRDPLPPAKPSGTDETAATMPAAYPTVAGEWSARWMRWIERDGRLTAAWARDYRGGEAQAQRLTGEILAFSREHKLPLQRIVINGHERWCSAEARQAREAVCR